MLNLSQILGQPMATESLRRAAARRRPFHAYLFSGPDAVGKATAACAFAAALLCAAPGAAGDACGACSSCGKLARGHHPDFRTIGIDAGDAAANRKERFRISIDQIRQNPTKPRVTPPPLVNDIVYHPIMGDWKVYLIDPADLLTDEAGSALLKVLEEPPDYAVIILITARPGLVLPTLRSRCWPVGFRLAGREQIEAALTDRDIETSQARLFSALSEGRVGWAITQATSRAEQVEAARKEIIGLASRLPALRLPETLRFAESLREIALEHFLRPAGTESEDEADDAEESAAAAARAPGSERDLRASVPVALDMMVCWLRDLMLVAGGAKELVANQDCLQEFEKIASQLRPEQIRACIFHTLEAKDYIQRFANPVLATEALAIQLQREMG